MKLMKFFLFLLLDLNKFVILNKDNVNINININKYKMEQLLNDLKNENVIKTSSVYNSMLQVDRADFTERNPYYDSPQSIGYNATISAPHMHAYALEYLAPFCQNGIHILDVGSGSGYLTVALSKMINDSGVVIGVEHIDDLYKKSIENISKHHSDLLNNNKVIIFNEDGRKGLKKYAPFKIIHVGAAAEEIPKDLIEQLDNNGRMFIPVGKPNRGQWIYVVDKDQNGIVSYNQIMGVSYDALTDKEKQLSRY